MPAWTAARVAGRDALPRVRRGSLEISACGLAIALARDPIGLTTLCGPATSDPRERIPCFAKRIVARETREGIATKLLAKSPEPYLPALALEDLGWSRRHCPTRQREESTDLMRLIAQIIQIEPELFQSHWNDDLDINPIIIPTFFLDVCRYRKGSLHNLNPKFRNRSRRFNDLPLVFGIRVNLSSAPCSEYRCETGSAPCLKKEIFSLPRRQIFRDFVSETGSGRILRLRRRILLLFISSDRVMRQDRLAPPWNFSSQEINPGTNLGTQKSDLLPVEERAMTKFGSVTFVSVERFPNSLAAKMENLHADESGLLQDRRIAVLDK